MKVFPVVAHRAFDPEFLGRSMSFVSGPRQIGKTTLTRSALEKINQERNYYNWDTLTVKRSYAKNPLFFLENIPEPVPSIRKKYQSTGLYSMSFISTRNGSRYSRCIMMNLAPLYDLSSAAVPVLISSEKVVKA